MATLHLAHRCNPGLLHPSLAHLGTSAAPLLLPLLLPDIVVCPREGSHMQVAEEVSKKKRRKKKKRAVKSSV
jgi:hypothetical protein